MKNLKIAMKLIVSFVLVVALAIVVGVVGIFGMTSINKAGSELYSMNFVSTNYLNDIAKNYINQRVTIRDILIYDTKTDNYANSVKRLATLETQMNDLIALYQPTISSTQEDAVFDKVLSDYQTGFAKTKAEMLVAGEANDFAGSVDILVAGATVAGQITANLDAGIELNKTAALDANTANLQLANMMTIIEIAVLLIAVIIALILAFYISSLIARPISKMVEAIKAIAIGDMSKNVDYDAKDEVGVMAAALSDMIAGISKQVTVVEHIADGDLTVTAQVRSDKDTMGQALVKTLESLNSMFGEISTATSQVSNGSKQVADGSQQLAQGSTEQAAAVEQLSSSISEIAGKTKQNADMANNAASLSDAIKTNAQKGSGQMQQMMQAVKEISEASQSINKVIKVIDDIAFQTNILALNAAVEAARAGQHGKGFAVVAEEVRNLAAKSAVAAKDTGSLIANSMEKAELGAKIASETSASLSEIVSGINESSAIVGEIARSSEEQSMAISQINKGIDQVSQVVQQNSATAEESAAASEEMSSQSNVLESLVSQFKLKSGNTRSLPSSSSSSSARKQLSMPSKQSYTQPMSNASASDDFGKY